METSKEFTCARDPCKSAPLGSRMSYRRHLLKAHNCDLKWEKDGSVSGYSFVAQLSAAEAASRLTKFRRRYRRNKPYVVPASDDGSHRSFCMSVQACLPADTLRRLGPQPAGLQEDDDITSDVSEFSSHQDQSFD